MQDEPTPTLQRLGRYRLAYELASGGMATVYMGCIDGAAGFEKVVAIKRIHPHLAKEKSYVDMFLDEARLASRIEHPNVCGVTDFGEAGGSYFLVMEFLVGVPLNKLLGRLLRLEDGLPKRWPAIASRLLADAAEGLHAAHELRDGRGDPLGVVHRDVSPSNLFVGFDGAVRVVDFGIAKAADRLHQTRTGEVKGKLAYMAPEQVRHDDVNRRVDVWALGVVGWEMLALRRLFKASNDANTLYAVLEQKVTSPSHYTPSVPDALDRAILHALERSEAARTPSARAFGREVEDVWVASGTRPVTALEVGDFLRELFPGEEERQRNLIGLARQRRAAIPVVGPAAAEEESFSHAMSQPEAPSHTHTLDGPPKAAPLQGEVRAAPSSPAVVLEATPRRGGRLRVAILLGAIAFAGAGGLGAGLMAGTSPQEPLAEEPASLELTESESTASVKAQVTAPPPVEEPPEVEPDVALPAEQPAPSRRVAPRPAARRGARTKRPPPAPPPPSTEPGRVAVVVPGSWANVYDAEGRLLGATPLAHSMPAGTHRLTLRFRGEPPPVTVRVEVPAGGTVRVSRRDPGP